MSEHKRSPNFVHKGLQLTKDQILEAMANTNSNDKAADYMGISYRTYKKYAKMYRDDITGKTLWDTHMNQGGVGIGKYWVGGQLRVNWEKILTTNQKATPEKISKLRVQLKEYKKLEEKCYRCGFETKRLEDNKIPLVLNFKSGDKTDWTIQNLEYVCYNCCFLYALDFYDYKQDIIDKVELYALNAKEFKKDRKDFLQLDDFYLDHIKKLGVEFNQLNIEEPSEPVRDASLDDLVDYI